jgi:ferric-dicitrate binding protein FerR (iron transport regulator)
MKNKNKHSNWDWKELAAKFSDEKRELSGESGNFSTEDQLNTEKIWRQLGNMNDDKEINVDNAWGNLYSRLRENGLVEKTVRIDERSRPRFLLRIAATLLIIIGLGATFIYLHNSGYLTKDVVISSNADQRNIEINLPDGSKAWLNRNSRLSYDPIAGKKTRNVNLRGEAFFEIVRDTSKPFIIDAGKAKVKVLGTSFDVISSNSNDEVEVFVKTGKVLVSDASGKRNMVLEPGYIGTIDSGNSTKTLNEDKNYLSWNTDLLVYDGQKLGVVFSDLKKVHNINVIADDPEILNETIAITFDNLPQDTIIRLICTTFNLNYRKDGQYYHLSKK